MEDILARRVLDVLKRQSPDTWTTAESLMSDMKNILLKMIEDTLESMHEKDIVTRAFNNVGDKSYKVYRVHVDNRKREDTPNGV